MKIRLLSLAATAILLLGAVGCSDSKQNSDSSASDKIIGSAVESEKADSAAIDSIFAAEKYLDDILTFEKNYTAFIDNENIKGYKINKGCNSPLKASKSVTVEGKSVTLPAPCKDVEKKLSLTYADKVKKDAALSAGTTAARIFTTEKGKEITLALYSDVAAAAEKSEVVGISISGAADLSFSALSEIENDTSLKAAIEKLGKPDYVAAAKGANGILIDLQYTSGDFVRIVYNSLLKMENLTIEF